MATIDDLRALGYDVEHVWGDVGVEQDALAEAQARAAPEVVEADAAEVTRRAMDDLRARGFTNEVLIAKAAEIAAAALEMTRVARDEEVAFHERAVVEAQAMPTVVAISGFGVENVQIALDNDAATPAGPDSQAVIDAVAHPRAHRWRRFDWLVDRVPPARRAAMQEARDLFLELRGKGYDFVIELQDDGTGLQAEIRNAETDELVRTVATLPQLRDAAATLPDLTPEGG